MKKSSKWLVGVMMLVAVLFRTPLAFLAWVIGYCYVKLLGKEEVLYPYAFGSLIVTSIYLWLMGTEWVQTGEVPTDRDPSFVIFELWMAFFAFITTIMLWVDKKNEERVKI